MHNFVAITILFTVFLMPITQLHNFNHLDLIMEAKFYENFEAFYANKRRLIITEDKYHQIVAALQKFSDPENSALKKTKDDFNTLSRFSIRTENSIAVLYHMTKNDPSRVVKKQELYGILKDAHIKLGHGGRDCMWQKLRTYYGISKYN